MAGAGTLRASDGDFEDDEAPGRTSREAAALRCDTVFVLGAGSSKEIGGPLLGEFESAAADLLPLIERPKEASRPFQAPSQRFRRALDEWRTTVTGTNLEEYYTLLDLKIRMNPHDWGLRRSADDLLYLVAKTLELKMGPGQSEHHKAMLKQALKLDSHATFVTLNWDVALDNAAGSNGFMVDYGTERALALPGQELNSGPPVTILKLHGSLNWWFCKVCRITWFVPMRKDILWKWEVGRRHCPNRESRNPRQHSMAPMVLLPAAQKLQRGSHAHTSEIWTDAELRLRWSRRWVFVGYSFPPTDLQFRMFVRACLEQNQQLEQVCVVTHPENDPLSSSNPLIQTYRELFSGRLLPRGLHFHNQGFGRWVEEGIP